jgi:hypothetical protein
MKKSYYATSLFLALGLSLAACGDRENREEPLSRAPSERVAPPAAPEPRVGEAPGSPATEQGEKDRAEQPNQSGSSS